MLRSTNEIKLSNEKPVLSYNRIIEGHYTSVTPLEYPFLIATKYNKNGLPDVQIIDMQEQKVVSEIVDVSAFTMTPDKTKIICQHSENVKVWDVSQRADQPVCIKSIKSHVKELKFREMKAINAEELVAEQQYFRICRYNFINEIIDDLNLSTAHRDTTDERILAFPHKNIFVVITRGINLAIVDIATKKRITTYSLLQHGDNLAIDIYSRLENGFIYYSVAKKCYRFVDLTNPEKVNVKTLSCVIPDLHRIKAQLPTGQFVIAHMTFGDRGDGGLGRLMHVFDFSSEQHLGSFMPPALVTDASNNCFVNSRNEFVYATGGGIDVIQLRQFAPSAALKAEIAEQKTIEGALSVSLPQMSNPLRNIIQGYAQGKSKLLQNYEESMRFFSRKTAQENIRSELNCSVNPRV